MKTVLVFLLTMWSTLSFAAVPPFGVWEWVQTEDAEGTFTTPADLGYTVQFEFKNDMTVNEYHDENLFQDGVFWVMVVEFMGYFIPALTFDFGEGLPETCAYGIDPQGFLEMWWGANPVNGLPYFPLEIYAPRGPVTIENATWGSLKSLYR
jgi:hypothetical protein